MADEDYYKILGIGRDADQNAIKKAYRKLALKWHPDKNADNKEEAETTFKRISEAYDILSDTNKKARYDKSGKDGLTGGGRRYPQGFSCKFGSGGTGFSFRSADDIFKDFFEHDPFGEDILADLIGGGCRRTRSRAADGNVSRRRGPSSGGFSTSFSFSSGVRGSFKSSSTSTKVVNGRKVTTKKIVDNGKETVEVYEDNVLTKRTVDGVPHITGGGASASCTRLNDSS